MKTVVAVPGHDAADDATKKGHIDIGINGCRRRLENEKTDSTSDGCGTGSVSRQTDRNTHSKQ